MKRSFRPWIGVLSLLGPPALSSPAAAQDVASAEALFNHGLAAMEARNFKVGCAELAESQRLDPRAGTLFTLSQCEVRWGRVATAVTRLGDYLQLYERLTPEQKTRQGDRPRVAREQRDKLALDVPELTLSLSPGAPANTVVKRDDAVVASAALGLGLPVDPGEHVVSAQAPGGGLGEQRITLARGEKKSLVLDVEAAPTVVATVPVSGQLTTSAPAMKAVALVPEAGVSGRRVAAYVIGGVGVAGLVLGGVTGGLALGKKATITAHCGSGIQSSDETACDPTGFAASTSIRPLGLASTIGFAAGLAGVGTAVVLILAEPRRATPTTGARAPWIAASVLAAGPGGALVGAEGAW